MSAPNETRALRTALTWVKRAVLDIVASAPQLLAMRWDRNVMRGSCVALALALSGAPAVSDAGDLRGVRFEDLRGDLRSARRETRWAPRASIYELKQLRRRLAEQRVDTPNDPRLERLELQRRHDLWQAERVLRQARTGLEGAQGQLAAPAGLRAPTDLDIRGDALPIGTGKRFLFIQSGLRSARAALDRGQVTAAAGHLAGAEGDFRELRAVAADDDPNLVALQAEIAALRARIRAADPG
jgi:hypothetical protein